MKKLLFILSICFTVLNTSAQNDPSLTVGDTGTITFIYQGSAVTYTTVRGADGMIWLQQNLGSPQIAAHATDSFAYGHYFQWGRLDDGHQVPGSSLFPAISLSANNPSAIPTGDLNFFTGSFSDYWWVGGNGSDTWSNAVPSPTNGTDPCVAIGPGWHLPSQSEFANAITLENIVDTLSAFNSGLKLTVSGFRGFLDGELSYLDTSGDYWTSSASNDLADHVNISVFNGVSANYPTFRGYGMSVRCLTTCTGVYTPDTIMAPDTVCGGTMHTFTTPAVTYASSYIWSLPTGATIIGSSNGSSINVLMGNSSGTIQVRAANACDTSIAIVKNIVVNPAPQPVITQNGWVLSTGTYSSYQWLLNNNIIPGATTNPYTATTQGSYKVVVTDSYGCSDTSSLQVTLGVENISAAESIQMYPNPAITSVTVNAPFVVNAIIYSMDGRIVLQQQNAHTLDISNLSTGIYQVKLTDSDGVVITQERLVVSPR